jgi:hypothetical protein
MTAGEQLARMGRMRRVVAHHDAHRWAADMLTDAVRLRTDRVKSGGSAEFAAAL